MKSEENSHFGNVIVRQSGQKWPDIDVNFNVPKSPHKHFYVTVVLLQKRPEETLNIGQITIFRKVEKTAILERLW